MNYEWTIANKWTVYICLDSGQKWISWKNCIESERILAHWVDKECKRVRETETDRELERYPCKKPLKKNLENSVRIATSTMRIRLKHSLTNNEHNHILLEQLCVTNASFYALRLLWLTDYCAKAYKKLFR